MFNWSTDLCLANLKTMSKIYQVKVSYNFEIEVDDDAVLNKKELEEFAKEQFDEKLMNIDVDVDSFDYKVILKKDS